MAGNDVFFCVSARHACFGIQPHLWWPAAVFFFSLSIRRFLPLLLAGRIPIKPQGRNKNNNNGQNKNIPKEKRSADGAAGDGATVEKNPGLPWLQLLHLWVHEVAFRDSRLRKCVWS